ncbi:MAG TPA: prolipoprotein diacylglyceryl transferase, partial [Dehalococcoidia bacterium]|nr:prolipoprotein diacylglyceryl transferase [Dehalococcoidia bacterium]
IDIDPNILQIGPFVLTWHGVFSAIGLAAGIWSAAFLGKRQGLAEDDIYGTALWGVVGAIIGARLFHVIDSLPYYAQNPGQAFLINEGGIAIFGAVVGGPIGGAIYARWRRLPIGKLADLGALGLILGQAIGRIGDIINGEHYAVPTDLPFGVRYVHPNSLDQRGEVVHLAVGYEMILDLIIFGILLGLWRRLGGDGRLFWIYLALYSIARFFLSFLRLDTIVAFGLRQAQLVAVASVIVSAVMLGLLLWRQGRGPAPVLEVGPGGSDHTRRSQSRR